MKQDGPVRSTDAGQVEDTVRLRLRSLRQARGWTLDDLARRSHLGASTISRIETGHRRVALDQLVSLARALGVSVDDLLAPEDADDVVIRPIRDTAGGITSWALTRHDDPSGRVVLKMRIPARRGRPEPRVHPGREWFTVVSGTARLLLGDREHLVEEGQAAEFDTMTPHAISGHGGPVEVISIFDRLGEQAHLH